MRIFQTTSRLKLFCILPHRGKLTSQLSSKIKCFEVLIVPKSRALVVHFSYLAKLFPCTHGTAGNKPTKISCIFLNHLFPDQITKATDYGTAEPLKARGKVVSFRYLVILLRSTGWSQLHANNASHSLNLLPKALSKKCHRPQRDNQFPERSPVKAILHYNPPPPVSLSLFLFHGLFFFLSTSLRGAVRGSCVRSVSLPRRRNVPRIIVPLKRVGLTKSGPHRNWPSVSARRERQKAQRQDDTPAESSINTIPGNQETVSGFLALEQRWSWNSEPFIPRARHQTALKTKGRGRQSTLI